MKSTILFGIALIVLGVVALAYQGITYTTVLLPTNLDSQGLVF
jgi:hypothetical protein